MAPFTKKLKLKKIHLIKIIFYLKSVKHLLWGSSIFKFELIIDRNILSNSHPGTISIVFLAQQCFNILTQIISKPIVITKIRRLSELFISNKMYLLKKEYKFILYSITLINIFALALLLLLFLFCSKKYLTIDFFNYNLEEFLLILIALFGWYYFGLLGEASSLVLIILNKTYKMVVFAVIVFIIINILKFYCYNYYGIYMFLYVSSLYVFINFIIQNYIIIKKCSI